MLKLRESCHRCGFRDEVAVAPPLCMAFAGMTVLAGVTVLAGMTIVAHMDPTDDRRENWGVSCNELQPSSFCRALLLFHLAFLRITR